MKNYERNAIFSELTLKSTMLKFSSSLFWTGKQFEKFWCVSHSFCRFHTVDKLVMKLFRLVVTTDNFNSEFKVRFV